MAQRHRGRYSMLTVLLFAGLVFAAALTVKTLPVRDMALDWLSVNTSWLVASRGEINAQIEVGVLQMPTALNVDDGLHGPLHVSSDNPRYFADERGHIVYLTGSHTWSNFQDNGGTNPPPAFDYEQYLDFLEANNHNVFRLWTWEESRWTVETADDNYWFYPMGPFIRTGPGNALDGEAKWDLMQFDQSYFDRMAARGVGGSA